MGFKVFSSLEYNKPNHFQFLIQEFVIDATVTSSQFETEVRSSECTTDGLVS